MNSLSPNLRASSNLEPTQDVDNAMRMHMRVRAQSFRALDPMRFPVCQGGASIGGYGFGGWRYDRERRG